MQVPEVDNLLVAGRCVAGDKVSHAAMRNMMACTVSGQTWRQLGLTSQILGLTLQMLGLTSQTVGLTSQLGLTSHLPDLT